MSNLSRALEGQSDAKRKRIVFALKHADEIDEKVRDFRQNLWREKAKEAKLLGLYSPKTFDYDAAISLRRYAEDYHERNLI